jgi:hypothetical protein
MLKKVFSTGSIPKGTGIIREMYHYEYCRGYLAVRAAMFEMVSETVKCQGADCVCWKDCHAMEYRDVRVSMPIYFMQRGEN